MMDNLKDIDQSSRWNVDAALLCIIVLIDSCVFRPRKSQHASAWRLRPSTTFQALFDRWLLQHPQEPPDEGYRLQACPTVTRT